MIHLYCGDGKGKTTAAMGLALRMAGRGKPVVIAQFLKGADSGERYALSLLPKVTLLPAPEQIKFSFQLTPEEWAAEQKRYLRLIAQARTAAAEIPDGLLVLDEVCAAVNTGLLPLEEVLSCLEAAACEVVLTGRDPAPELLARADYARGWSGSPSFWRMSVMQKKVTIFQNVRRNRIFFTRAGRKTVKNTQEVVAIFPSNRYNGECDIPAEQDRRTIGVGRGPLLPGCSK